MNKTLTNLEYIKQLENENSLLRKRNLELIKMMNELAFQSNIKNQILIQELNKQKQHSAYLKIVTV